MRVVLDTNVVVSSFLSSTGPPGRIRSALEDLRFDLVASEPLLDEYQRALNYPRVAARHQLSAGEIATQVNGIRRIAALVVAADVPNVIPEDPADNMVVATAVAGNVHYIVSGDDDLHRLGEYEGIQILSPTLFMGVLRL
jgi:putative PIN family toxin of toxin-antitoxin system